jgi:serine/threonine-protein kinase
MPFFSPDGLWIGFFTGNKLNKISVDGGAVVPLADTFGATGASWGNDGNIIVGQGLNKGLLRVPASGGDPTTVAEPAPGESDYTWPQILPGGKAVLFVAFATTRTSNTANIEVYTFADRRRKTLVRGGTCPRYLPSGHLVYTSKGTLFAIAFDVTRLETSGTPVVLLDDVAYEAQYGDTDVDFSETGTLVYRRGSGGGESGIRTMQWVDSAGQRETLRAKPDAYSDPRLSPDGKRMAFVVGEGASRDVRVYDPQRDVMTRLTFDGGPYSSPIWSPDGRYVVFGAIGKGMFWTRADGSGQAQPLTQSKDLQNPWSFTPDGKRLAYYEIAGNSHIWTLPLEDQGGQLKAGKPEQFQKSQFGDFTPMFSPDGHWLAYASDETGKDEVYVRAYPPPASGQGGKWQISINGGDGPLWSRNGHKLVYLSGGQLMAVSYSVNGDSFVAEKPRVWIEKLGGGDYALAPDGKRVAVLTPVASTQGSEAEHEVTFLFNFMDELRRRVPVTK